MEVAEVFTLFLLAVLIILALGGLVAILTRYLFVYRKAMITLLKTHVAEKLQLEDEIKELKEKNNALSKLPKPVHSYYDEWHPGINRPFIEQVQGHNIITLVAEVRANRISRHYYSDDEYMDCINQELREKLMDGIPITVECMPDVVNMEDVYRAKIRVVE